ncbi:MAG: HAMP domain-containing histidine kinase [Patescibacteria group bacterium]|nr:HAMP domain-containing histidine kinase [Patescibacteria group bacterium]
MITSPAAGGEDDARRGYLLNVILAISIALFAALELVIVWNFFTLDGYRGLHPVPFAFFLIACSAIYAISRSGRVRLASFLLIAFYAIGTMYAGWMWGASLPATLFGIALVIVTTGVFMEPGPSALVSVAMIAVFAALGAHEAIALDLPDWRLDEVNATDIISYSAGFLFLSFIAWLSSREISRSLARARRSERLLTEERDDLERRIAERTASLLEAEQAKTEELERTAKFGELAKGLFHDLMSPLTALSIRAEHIAASNEASGFAELKKDIEPVTAASKKMLSFMESMKRCMAERQGTAETGSDAFKEASAARDMLAYAARMSGVSIDISEVAPVSVPAHPTRLNQIFLNLISNGIEACAAPGSRHSKESGERSVSASARSDGRACRIEVRDNGCGMSPADAARAFDRGFSTKPDGGGRGLATVKDIVQEAGGSAHIAGSPGEGAAVIILFPARADA